MNFFLIANNNSITDKTINSLPIEEEDIIVLYNRQMPLKWKKIKSHKNKILFLRGKEDGFHGEGLLNNSSISYNDIILTSPLINISDTKNFKDKYNINNLVGYSYKEDIKNLNIFNGKSPQVGLISYIYILKKLNFKKIYLIGFTNEYKSGIWYKHSKEIEQNFYKSEILKNNFIIKIDN